MGRLLSLVGTPTPHLYAMLNVVRALTQVTLGDHLVVVANSIDTLRSEFRAQSFKSANAVVLFSDYPQASILSTLVSANAPVAICVDNFASIAHYSVVSRDFTGVTAARFASMGLVNIEEMVVAPPRLSLNISDPQKKLETLIGDLAALYHIPLHIETTAGILEFLGCEPGRAETLAEYADRAIKVRNDACEILEKRSPLENELIDFLALQYDGIARGGQLKQLEWPVYALLQPEFPDRLTIGPIDLTGPARFIYCGPYFALPAGVWRADISLEVRDCLSDNWIAIDVFSGKVLAVIKAKLPAQGVYGCEIQFQIEDSSVPVDIRVQLVSGAIEGVLQMRRIVLHRIDAADESDDEAR